MTKIYYPFDYTFLYDQIYHALIAMEPYIIGGNSFLIYTEQFERRFKLAISLADKIRHNEYRHDIDETKAFRIFHKLMVLESRGWWG